MESIPGFRTDLSQEEFLRQLAEIEVVLTGQTGDLAPADGKLYALRDVTGTVPSIPLIASSVMSKKIAAGAHGIVLDVKVGLGAFMKSVEEAQKLAELMVAIADKADRKAVALLSDMNQPLGHAVGNVLEVKEAIQTLQGGGPVDFKEHCLEVAGHMLVLGGICEDIQAAREMLVISIAEGRAWDRFNALVKAQGGDVSYLEAPERFPNAKHIETVPSPRDGYLEKLNARVVGETSVLLGGGRTKKGDPIDHAVGLIIHHKVGDQVSEGEPLFEVHANSKGKLKQARQLVLDAHKWSEIPVDPLPLFYGVVQ
jgi:pyrimidine-nucleoside phosphorylase